MNRYEQFHDHFQRHYQEYQTAEVAFLKVVKKSGLRAIHAAMDGGPINVRVWAHPTEVSRRETVWVYPTEIEGVTALREIVKRHRRVRVTIAAAVDAGKAYLDAYGKWEGRQITGQRRKQAARRIQHVDAYKRNRAFVFGSKLRPSRPVRNAQQLIKYMDSQRRGEIVTYLENSNNAARTEYAVIWGNPENVGVDVAVEEDFSEIRKAYGHVKRSYRIRVHAVNKRRADLPGGRRNLDGVLTLDCEQVAAPCDGVRMWRATWITPSRGVSWDTEHGYIASMGEDFSHAATAKGAVANLRRRRTIESRGGYLRLAARAANRKAARVAAAASYLATLSSREVIERHGDLRLTFAVARGAGLCEAGIKSWCARNVPDLDYRTDSVSVAEALTCGDLASLVLDAVAVAIARAGAYVEREEAVAA